MARKPTKASDTVELASLYRSHASVSDHHTPELIEYIHVETPVEKSIGNGGGKLDHGSGGIGPLRAE